MERSERLPGRVVDRYAIFDTIATGGMATVCFGRLVGPKGFARTVVVKQLHPQLAADPDVATMFQDEARIAARIRHPNVVPVIDIVSDGGELLLVMEYVHGESLAYLARADERSEARVRVVVNAVAAALHGLHAAHEATGDGGTPLGVVHRDVSPQNILVGVDGVARVVDFGVAKAAGQSHATGVGQVKGKIRFLAPEQVVCDKLDRRADVWGAAVVLWEALTQRRLFSGENDAAAMMEILHKDVPSPRVFAPEVPEAVAVAILRGLSREVDARFPTALAMAEALEAAAGLCSTREIGAWVEQVAGDRLAARRRVLDDIEAETLAGPAEGRALPAPQPPDDLLLTPAPATPTAPAPPLPVARRPRRRARAVVVGWIAGVTLVLAVGFLAARALLSGAGRAGASRSAVMTTREEPPPRPIDLPPVASPEPPSAPLPSPSAAPSPPAPSSPAAAPDPPRVPAPPPRDRPRAAPSTSPRADFQVPLYGRD